MTRAIWTALLVVLPVQAVGAAESMEGTGRLAVLPGWRYTPNDYFYRSAARAGFPASSTSPGALAVSASFSYAAEDWAEVSLDAFVSSENLHLAGVDPLQSITYGLLIGARLQAPVQPSFWKWGIIPYLGLFTGPTLIYERPAGGESHEAFVQSYAVAVGVTVRATEHVGVTLEAKLMMARGFVPGIGGINGGGGWFGVGVSYFFAKEPSNRPLSPM